MTEHALRVLVEERIAELWRWRHWYRRNRWADWTGFRHDNEVELRALVRLARRARDIAEAEPDPITEAHAYAFSTESERASWVYEAWTEPEKRAAWGDR